MPIETTVDAVVHVAHFLAEPLTDLPARRPESLRRTSSVDMIGNVGGDLELIGLARDQNASAASCHATVAPDRTLSALSVTPALETASLLGRVVGRGFRAAVDQLAVPGTLSSVLLCELPVAALLSGYGSLYTGQLPIPLSDEFLAGMPVDICAGWAAPSSMVLQIRAERSVPTPDGPIAPLAIDAAWHAMAPLAPGSMRRQRLIQRDGDEVWAMFRDTYARPDGVVIVLHEYSVVAGLAPVGDSDGPRSRSRSRVVSCVATPHVLPWLECPAAAASATRAEGVPVAELRALVKDELVGTSTCTHLNDLLSSLAQADALV
jgi:hypothetical protein